MKRVREKGWIEGQGQVALSSGGKIELSGDGLGLLKGQHGLVLYWNKLIERRISERCQEGLCWTHPQVV